MQNSIIKKNCFSGPGVFFIIPCVDVYEKIDMRSQTFEIPPQEVISFLLISSFSLDSQICRLFKSSKSATRIDADFRKFLDCQKLDSNILSWAAYYTYTEDLPLLFIALYLQILTKDSVTVFVNAILYYKVPLYFIFLAVSFTNSCMLKSCECIQNK